MNKKTKNEPEHDKRRTFPLIDADLSIFGRYSPISIDTLGTFRDDIISRAEKARLSRSPRRAKWAAIRDNSGRSVLDHALDDLKYRGRHVPFSYGIPSFIVEARDFFRMCYDTNRARKEINKAVKRHFT